MSNLNYERDIHIDSEALDIEWLEQSSLMMKYSQNVAQLQKEVDEAKESIELIKAELDKKIRSKPEKYGIVKITDTQVASTILMQQSYQIASTAYIDAKFELNTAKGAVDAFEHRKNSLENLVKLHGQQYFAGPKIPRDLTKEWQKKQDQREYDKKVKIKRG
jgi:hypothetical protein